MRADHMDMIAKYSHHGQSEGISIDMPLKALSVMRHGVQDRRAG